MDQQQATPEKTWDNTLLYEGCWDSGWPQLLALSAFSGSWGIFLTLNTQPLRHLDVRNLDNRVSSSALFNLTRETACIIKRYKKLAREASAPCLSIESIDQHCFPFSCPSPEHRPFTEVLSWESGNFCCWLV